MFPSGEVGAIGDASLFGKFEGIDTEPDRLVNTLSSFERVRFFGTGDTRPGFRVTFSIGDDGVSLREFERCSRCTLLLSISDVVSKICSIDKFCESFLMSSCFNRCLCSDIQYLKLGDSIATFIALSNNVRK
jgi:hypothetical protein